MRCQGKSNKIKTPKRTPSEAFFNERKSPKIAVAGGVGEDEEEEEVKERGDRGSEPNQNHASQPTL